MYDIYYAIKILCPSPKKKWPSAAGLSPGHGIEQLYFITWISIKLPNEKHQLQC